MSASVYYPVSFSKHHERANIYPHFMKEESEAWKD